MCKLISIIVLVTGFLTFGCYKKGQVLPEQKDYSDITAQELMEEIERGEKFVLVDVRTPDKYAEGHIKGAILIPHTEIETRYKEVSKRFG